jgi:hypothetical protein
MIPGIIIFQYLIEDRDMTHQLLKKLEINRFVYIYTHSNLKL